MSPGRWEYVKLVQNFFRHTQKRGWYEFFYIENTQKTILKTRLYELICSAFSQPLYGKTKSSIPNIGAKNSVKKTELESKLKK